LFSHRKTKSGRKVLVHEDGSTTGYSSSIPPVPLHALVDTAHCSDVLEDLARRLPEGGLTAATIEKLKESGPNGGWLRSLDATSTVAAWLDAHCWTRSSKALMAVVTRCVFGVEPKDLSLLYLLLYGTLLS
jgi:hypothetical protein